MIDRDSDERDDRSLLDRALSEEVPLGAADLALEVSLGGWKQRLSQLLSIVVIGIFIGGFYYLFGFAIGPFTMLVCAGGVLIAIGSGFPDFRALDQALTISAQGVRLQKLHREQFAPWWAISKIYARNDLSAIRFAGASVTISIDTSKSSDDVRKSIIFAVRAREPYHGTKIEVWPRGGISGKLRRGAALVGPLFIFAAFFLFFPGRTLGMRCSVNSAFLQETFDTPARQGCVVLRVSAGAEDAGIQRGDLVIEMEGYPVTSGQQFSYLFDESDRPWDFVVVRKGAPEPLRFKVEGGRGENFKEDPNDPFFYYLRGRWDADDKPEQAIEDYSRAVDLEPDFDLAYLYRGELYQERGDWELARQDYEKALELSPELGEAHSFYAYFVDVEDPESARDHIETAVELDNCRGAFERYNIDCSADYLLLASLSQSDAREMAAISEQAIRFYDGFAGNYFNAMCAYSLLGDEERAHMQASRFLKFPDSDREPERTELAKSILDGAGAC